MKTAKELGIEQREIDALVWVRDQLRLNNLHHLPITSLPKKPSLEQQQDGVRVLPAPCCFNMGYVEAEYPCGTVACIGGWAAKHMKIDAEDYVNGWTKAGDLDPRPDDLRHLFWANTNADTTPEQAAQAIDNYLAMGEPCWDAVMGDDWLPG